MRVVVLLSGGVDSALLMGLAAERSMLAGAVFVDYGQPAAAPEWSAAQHIAGRYGVPLHRVGVGLVGMDDMRAAPGTGPRVVAGRNAVLLALGCNIAAGLCADCVWLGATADDRRDYPDCRAEFARMWCRTSRLAFDPPIEVEYPLVNMTRREVLGECGRLGVDVSRAWSCYVPTVDGASCGVCSSCVARG